MKVNIIVTLAFILQGAYGLKCYKCNQTEIFTRRCVFDSADEVECAEGEVCSFGRTDNSKDRPDLIGCERKEICDEDRANGVSCETCDTDLCNLYSRPVVSLEHRVQVINVKPGMTIIKEEIPLQPVPTDPHPVNNGPSPFPGLNFPFFNMPNFGGFGFNNYGFSNFGNPPQGNFPPYAPFVGFGGPFARPPFIQEPEYQPVAPVPGPIQETVVIENGPAPIPPPKEEAGITLQETVLQFAENNKPDTTTTVNDEAPTTIVPEKTTEASGSTTQNGVRPTTQQPSLVSTILQQFPSESSSVKPTRNPSISDLVLNLSNTNNNNKKKPLQQLPLDAVTNVETTTPLDVPVTIPEIIEEVNTESTQPKDIVTELPVNKDYVAELNLTTTDEIPTTVKSDARINDENDEIEEDDEENIIEPSLTEPENLLFNIRSKLKTDTQERQVEFPVAEADKFFFETNTDATGTLTFEESNTGLPETPIFGHL